LVYEQLLWQSDKKAGRKKKYQKSEDERVAV